MEEQIEKHFDLSAFKRDLKREMLTKGMSTYDLAEVLGLPHMTAYRLTKEPKENSGAIESTKASDIPSLANFAKACHEFKLPLEKYLTVKRSLTAEAQHIPDKSGFNVSLFLCDVQYERKVKGFTQAKIAEKIGMDPQAYCKIEKSGRGLNIEYFYRLVTALGLYELDRYLFCRTYEINKQQE